MQNMCCAKLQCWIGFRRSDKSDDMKIKDTFVTGLATGALVGLFMALVTQISYGSYHVMYWWWSALLTAIGVPLTSTITVLCLSLAWGCCETHLKHLIPVACLTFFVPVLGPVFGGPGGIQTIPIITILGAVGGLVWSSLYVLLALLWSFIKGRTGTSRDSAGGVPLPLAEKRKQMMSQNHYQPPSTG